MHHREVDTTHAWWMYLGLASSIVLLDQIVKQTVVVFMPYGASYGFTPFFNLVHVGNTGAAFSFLAEGNWRYTLSALGIGVSLVLAWLLARGTETRLEAAAYVLVMGGALGNVCDRLLRGMVVDYLDFHWGGWHWPAFNVADIAITAGAVALIIGAARSPASTVVDGPKAPSRQRGTTARAPRKTHR